MRTRDEDMKVGDVIDLWCGAKRITRLHDKLADFEQGRAVRGEAFAIESLCCLGPSGELDAHGVIPNLEGYFRLSEYQCQRLAECVHPNDRLSCSPDKLCSALDARRVARGGSDL